MNELPCIKCSKQLEPAFGGSDTRNAPWGATVFISYGQYGSTLFDEMDGTYLELNICDDCLREIARAGKILHVKPQQAPPPRPTYRTWLAWEDETDEIHP